MARSIHRHQYISAHTHFLIWVYQEQNHSISLALSYSSPGYSCRFVNFIALQFEFLFWNCRLLISSAKFLLWYECRKYQMCHLLLSMLRLLRMNKCFREKIFDVVDLKKSVRTYIHTHASNIRKSEKTETNIYMCVHCIGFDCQTVNIIKEIDNGDDNDDDDDDDELRVYVLDALQKKIWRSYSAVWTKLKKKRAWKEYQKETCKSNRRERTNGVA